MYQDDDETLRFLSGISCLLPLTAPSAGGQL